MTPTRSSKRPTLPELMGSAEVAKELGIDNANVNAVVGLPEPVARVRATRLWLAVEVREFAREYRKRREARAKKTAPV